MICAKCKLDKKEEDFYFHKKKGEFNPWCRPCNAEYARERRKKRKGEGKFCTGCYKPAENKLCDLCLLKPIDKDKAKKRTKAWREKNPDYYYKYRKEKKGKVINAYGNKCNCCNEDTFEFLTIDHINGGGHQHRKEVKNIYSWLIKNNFPSGFRTLCMNCNFALGRYGYCPHQKSICHFDKLVVTQN